jgi:hypothetical protein
MPNLRLPPAAGKSARQVTFPAAIRRLQSNQCLSAHSGRTVAVTGCRSTAGDSLSRKRVALQRHDLPWVGPASRAAGGPAVEPGRGDGSCLLALRQTALGQS